MIHGRDASALVEATRAGSFDIPFPSPWSVVENISAPSGWRRCWDDKKRNLQINSIAKASFATGTAASSSR
jgi:hypothetical protein